MNWWKLAYKMNWIDAKTLKTVVKTENNIFGEITPEQYKTITGKEYN